MRNCQNCGNQILDTDKHCNKCGAGQVNDKILCRASLVLFISAIFMLFGHNIISNFVNIDSDLLFKILFFISVFLCILAVILVVIVRVNVPKNEFAKDLLRVYLACIFGFVLIFIIFMWACNTFCTNCKID